MVIFEGQRQHPDARGTFDNAPYVNFNDGQLKSDTNWTDNANDNYGSVSGFLPKSLLLWRGRFSERPLLTPCKIAATRQASARSRRSFLAR